MGKLKRKYNWKARQSSDPNYSNDNKRDKVNVS